MPWCRLRGFTQRHAPRALKTNPTRRHAAGDGLTMIWTLVIITSTVARAGHSLVLCEITASKPFQKGYRAGAPSLLPRARSKRSRSSRTASPSLKRKEPGVAAGSSQREELPSMRERHPPVITASPTWATLWAWPPPGRPRTRRQILQVGTPAPGLAHDARAGVGLAIACGSC